MRTTLTLLLAAAAGASCASDAPDPSDELVADVAVPLSSFGSARSALGAPTSDLVVAGDVVWQRFAYGYATYRNGDTAIRYVGGKTDPAQKAVADRYGKLFDFSGGVNRWPLATDITTLPRGFLVTTHPAGVVGDAMIAARNLATVAYLVDGPIQDKWVALYGATPPNGALGFPIAEAVSVDATHRSQEFEYGVIRWDAATGAHVVANGAIRDTHERIGVVDFFLGEPSGDVGGTPRRLAFEDGEIVETGPGAAQVKSGVDVLAETAELGSYTLPAGSTATPLFLGPTLAPGDTLIVDNCTSSTRRAGETRLELGFYRSGEPFPFYTQESTTGCGGAGGARLVYVAGKTERTIVRISAEPGSPASGVVAYTVIKELSNPRPSGVGAIFAGLETHGTKMSAWGNGSTEGLDDAYHHLQGIARLNHRAHWDFAVSGAVRDPGADSSNFWLVKLGSKNVGDTMRFGGNPDQPSADDQVLTPMWLGSSSNFDHAGGLTAMGPYIFTGLEKAEVNDAYEIVAVDTRMDPPRTATVHTGNGGATFVAMTYLPRVPKVPTDLQGGYLMMIPGKGLARWNVFIKNPDADGRVDPGKPGWLSLGCLNRTSDDDANCPAWQKESEIGGDVSTDDYQSATLITQQDGTLYMAAFAADYGGLDADDWLDLWRVVWHGEAMPSGATCAHPVMCLVKAAKHHMYTTGILTEYAWPLDFNYISFDAGGSVYITPDREELVTYSSKYGVNDALRTLQWNEF